MECIPPTPEVIAAGDQKISNAIRETLDERFGVHGPHMVLDWHICASIMGEDGERFMWAVSADDSRVWEILGMLEYAKLQVLAAMTAERMED